MGLPQQKLQYQEMFFITGKVQQVIDTLYVVVIDQRKMRAVQAVGCLLVPETGDTVLLAENSADKAYILDHGKVIGQGTPREIIQDELIIKSYLGSTFKGDEFD